MRRGGERREAPAAMTAQATQTIPRAAGSPTASAARPIRGGPARNPKYPMVGTAAMAVPAGPPRGPPAAVERIGMEVAAPSPTTANPKSAMTGRLENRENAQPPGARGAETGSR